MIEAADNYLAAVRSEPYGVSFPGEPGNYPYAARLLAGCAPQVCYVDDYRSWSTNEVAINWNSALAQIAAFATDQG